MHGLEVLLHAQLIGHLSDEGPRAWSFTYLPSPQSAAHGAAQPISLALPRREEPHRGGRVHAVFANLLPEGEVRRRVAQSLGLSADNDFAMLARIGGDCHGALSLRVPGAGADFERVPRQLGEAELRNAVAVLPVHPLLVEADGMRATLPGEFDKLPARVTTGGVSLMLDGNLSTHILKPARPGLRESVMNEAYTMQLAADFGLPVAPCEVMLGQLAILSVSRVDRIHGEAVRAIHMEDICQIAGFDPTQKYEREGGPGLVDIVGLLRRFSVCPAVDLRALIQWTIFSFLVGFGAAHAKQLALLHGDAGPRLAPFFGLWSTHVYAEMNHRMGYAIGGEDRPDWLTAARWRQFASEVGVRPAYVLDQIAAAACALPPLALALAERFQRRHGLAGIVRKIAGLIEQRARQVLVSLEVEPRPE